MTVELCRAADSFSDWNGLLRLLTESFAFMEGRIDPPSSVLRLTARLIAAKATEEALFVATEESELVGCVFARRQADCVYVSKLAVRKDRQRRGIGRRLMQAVEEHARESGQLTLELQTRIELTENHDAFAAMGYVKVSEHAHEGYERPTFVTLRKRLAPSRG